MKKLLLIFFVLMLSGVCTMADTEKASTGRAISSEQLEPGQVVFKGEKTQNRYLASLHFRLAQNRNYDVKGVKVTSEPSGTVLFTLFSNECSENDKIIFLKGKMPLASFEGAISNDTMTPTISLDYPNSISGDNQIVVEYLIENNGLVSTFLTATITVRSVDSVHFSTIQAPKNAAGRTEQECPWWIICCTDPISRRCCQTPSGTCCCDCDDQRAICGTEKCPPPPC